MPQHTADKHLDAAVPVVNRRADTDQVEREEAVQETYAEHVRNRTVVVAGATVASVVAVNVLIIKWEYRVVVSVLITAVAFYLLTQNLRGISCDYATHSADLLHGPLLRPPPASDEHPHGDKVEFESVEWLNAVMDRLWPIVDRQLFVAAIDLMEDEMKSLMPGVIRSVRITSLEQGSHPVRLLGMRLLPPPPPSVPSRSALDPCLSPSSAPSIAAPRGTRARERNTAQATEPSEPAGTTTSAFADPTLPRPAPLAADAEEQDDSAEAAGAAGDRGEEGRPSVELDCEFGYRRKVDVQGSDGEAREGYGKKGKVEATDPTENIHFVAYLGIGVHKLTTIPFPVLISISSLRGSARLRLSFTPEPPFVKTAVISLREMPIVEIAAYPLKSAIDVVPLPLVRTMVAQAIQSTIAKFVAPRRYALDVRKMLLGGDVAIKTRTIGIVVLVVHRAHLSSPPSSTPSTSSRGNKHPLHAALPLTSLSRATGSVDPCVEVSWAGMGKVLYVTKVVREVKLGPGRRPLGGRTDEEGREGKEEHAEREAKWEEMCFVRVPREPVDDGAKIRLRVLDHERVGSSHCLGYLDLPIRSLHKKPGEWRLHRSSELKPDLPPSERDDVGNTVGTLEYSAAFFPLLERLPCPDAQKQQRHSDARNGDRKTNLYEGVDLSERAAEPDAEHEHNKRTRLDAIKDLLSGRAPAPDSHPSGILSFQVHSIAELQLDKRVGPLKAGMKRLKPGAGSKAMRRAELPSSYVQAFLNDEMVYRTKLEPFSNAPYFGSGSEAFVRDWKEANLSFAVMDYRDRDHDVLAGYVSINLRDVLQEQAQLSKWYPLLGGSGSGRLRLSILWKPLALDMHPNLREWSVGTLQLVSASISGLREQNFAGRLLLKPDKGDSAEVAALERQTGDPSLASDDRIDFDLSSAPVSLPILSRISPVEVALQGVATSGLKSGKRALASAVFHVNDIRRGGVQEIKIRLSREQHDVLPDLGPLPSLLGEQDGDDDEHAIEHHRVDDIFVDAREVSPSLVHDGTKNSESSSTPPIVLTLRARWHPGLSSAHANLVLSASSPARAAYQLYLHRRDYEAQLRREARGDDTDRPNSDDEGNSGEADLGEERGGVDADWENTDQDGEQSGQGMDEIEGQRDGTRKRKGGSLRWVRHNAKVFGRRLKKKREHGTGDIAPETEIQAAL